MLVASCKKSVNTPAPCVQIPISTINLNDSLLVVNCNSFELGVHIQGENERYVADVLDTLYVHFDTTGNFTLIYYNAGALISGPFYDFPIQVE